jgi:hypothetical protein
MIDHTRAFLFRTEFLLLILLTAGVLRTAHAEKRIFEIGAQDKRFTEFKRNWEQGRSVRYRVGSSTPENDWPAYHPGTFDTLVSRSTMQQDWTEVKTEARTAPFLIEFSLFDKPRGMFIFHLDAIFRYRRPAAPHYSLFINGKYSASYELRPHPTPDLWWPNGGEGDGNTQYFGYESLDMVLPATFFQRGPNTIALECVDGFGIFYDHLSLLNEPDRMPRLIESGTVEPTVLYKQTQSGEVELTALRVRSTRALGRITLKMVIGTSSAESQVTQDQAGDMETVVAVPALDHSVPVSLYVSGWKSPVYRGTFTPARRWRVYALPMEQADFGYNDLPARTLEWENRFIDKALQIQSKYPSYSFTLDAAANLESYLATRKKEKSGQMLDNLRSGKWGLNALFTNSFTGLATSEELYQGLHFSLRAGKRFGMLLDSASQTDEPSVTWALPQILSDAGVQYFTNGSDPIRGAFNPIGKLNFHSPFYWESASGAKVLMWSGISYTAVDDMTWGGWNPRSSQTGTYESSTFGLAHSLPMFLSQYAREDFPFNAVLLFGLHNDEIPMRHWGDADVIEEWNREYAFPKIIPGTQREFFTYIKEHFGDQIKVNRGDGGAYWEDEAGADARIATMIRIAQTQITEAEKFESIATWLQPHLNYDHRPFDEAWKNILLSDSYVWSDANSFRRPESYRTRGGEAAHRAWAEAALQQTSDLRLTAMDKIAELVQSSQPGAVVFNSENWMRSDLFNFELEPDEMMADPSTGQPIPCGAIKARDGYLDVRCWASNVPSTGYRFYSVVKGTTPKGEPVSLDPTLPAIENRFYRLELNRQTGAVAHLIDKESRRDLVGSKSDYQLNEYLYVSGGDPGTFISGNAKDNRILAADVTLPLPNLELHHATLNAEPQARRFPWGTILTVRRKAFNTPEIISTITLLDSQKQVRFENEVTKIATLKKEGIYFAYPFALLHPRVAYQGATAWVNPEIDMLPGANRQWFATQGGVRVLGDGMDICWSTVDAPLITLEDINRGMWPDSIQIQSGTVFSYVMNNYWYTDTPAQQGGKYSFRYALTSSHEIPEGESAIFAAEQRSPLFAIRRYNMGWNPLLPETGAGFLEAGPTGVSVLTMRAEKAEKDSYLLRIQNTMSHSVTARLHFSHGTLEGAFLSSVIGEQTGEVEWNNQQVSLPMRPYEIRSIVIKMRSRNSTEQERFNPQTLAGSLRLTR